MRILGIIPARFASTRLPGKPLKDIEGASLIQRVYQQAVKSKGLSDVVVATDDERIQNEVDGFGGKVVLTSKDHPSGTDRCFEALQQMSDGYDAVVNIQGDEPFIDPLQIDQVCSLLEAGAELATLIKRFQDRNEIADPNKVKVVFNTRMEALYFSRSLVPFDRNGLSTEYFQHIGIYGYRAETLDKIVALAPSSLEKTESLEQLRWLENGFGISLGITDLESLAVDTPEDLEKARIFARKFV